MRHRKARLSISAEATPEAQGSAKGATTVTLAGTNTGMVLDAKIVGGTGGTLDVYLQRKIDADTWVDWVHFPQVAAATTKYYTVTVTGKAATIQEVGSFDDAGTGTAVLAVNTYVDTLPQDAVRAYYTAGAGTSVAGSFTLRVSEYAVHE